MAASRSSRSKSRTRSGVHLLQQQQQPQPQSQSQPQPQLQPRPSLLTGLNLSITPPVNAEQIASELRARIEFASLKPANGLTLHSLHEIEQATLEAERIHAGVLAQQNHRQHSAALPATHVTESAPVQSTRRSNLSESVSPHARPSNPNPNIWNSPSTAINLAVQSESQPPQQQVAEQGRNQPRTIFDAIAARASTHPPQPTSTSYLLFPNVPLTSKSIQQPQSSISGQSPQSVKAASSPPSARTAVSAVTLLHRAASIPQLGSPRRLVNSRTELSDPHNEPSLETKEQERKLAVEFKQQQRRAAERERAILAQRRVQSSATGSLKRSHASSLPSIKEHEILPPPSKRARFSDASLSSQHGQSSWLSAHSPAGHLALLSARSPSTKLASSYARGVAASSAIGTGLARSPDTRPSRSINATTHASSLAFQSPRGLTLGQGLGITSRTSLNSVPGSPLNPNPRRREESFERSAPSPAAPSTKSSELMRTYQGSHASASIRVGQHVPSIASEQRTRPLLSPPPSSPAIRDESRMHRLVGAAPHLRPQDQHVPRKYAHFSPHHAGAALRRRQDGSATSAALTSAAPVAETRSPARMQRLSPKQADGAGTDLKVNAPSSTVSDVGQADESTRSAGTSASQTNLGLGFDFEHGAPADMPAPATPKKSAARTLVADEMHDKGQRTQDVDMDGSEAAQLMLFLAGSPSAPPSTRFTAGVTPSITSLAFESTRKGDEPSSVDGQEIQNSGPMRSVGRLQRSGDASNTILRGGRGLGSPGPEGKTIARMLSYGTSGSHQKDGPASQSPRSNSTAFAPTLGSGSAEISSTASSSTLRSYQSDIIQDNGGQPATSKSPATTPEPCPIVVTVSQDESDSRYARTQTPPPHSSNTAQTVTPPRQPPSTPKAPGSSNFSYAEYLNVSPSPQPRLRNTPRLGGGGKKVGRSSAGDRPYSADPSRTPSRMARGRFLDYDQELGLQSATIEHRKRFAQMMQIGEEGAGGAGSGHVASGPGHGDVLVPGPLESAASEPLLGAVVCDASPAALKEKSHNHPSGVLEASAMMIPRTTGAGAAAVAIVRSIGGGLGASPVLKAQMARPLALAPPPRDVAAALTVKDGPTEITSSGT
ncbi:unnamed protein product [Tilletia controversa]|nr:unnamed protein product [Tilletia controversa]